MPSSFTSPLTITQVGEKLWRLERDLIYHVRSLDSDEVITVPKGFEADGSSIPRFFWRVVGHPLYGANAPSGFLHDWLYCHHVYPQKRCDEIFLESLKVLGVSWWRRDIMYRALRMFGHIAYAKKVN